MLEKERDHAYDMFIVQTCISCKTWTSDISSWGKNRLCHVGTRPNVKGEQYVADLRMIVANCPLGGGFKPVGMYARQAHNPLSEDLPRGKDGGKSSWDQLSTNLSVKVALGQFTTETERLICMDEESLQILGLTLKELCQGFVQTCLCLIAID